MDEVMYFGSSQMPGPGVVQHRPVLGEPASAQRSGRSASATTLGARAVLGSFSLSHYFGCPALGPFSLNLGHWEPTRARH